MLTVDETQFLDQQKYFEANRFSTCVEPGCQTQIRTELFSALRFLNSLVLRPESEYFVVDAAVIR